MYLYWKFPSEYRFWIFTEIMRLGGKNRGERLGSFWIFTARGMGRHRD